MNTNNRKSNIAKKLTYEDKFGRKYFCKKYRRIMLQFEKKSNRRKTRRILNKYTNAEPTE